MINNKELEKLKDLLVVCKLKCREQFDLSLVDDELETQVRQLEKSEDGDKAYVARLFLSALSDYRKKERDFIHAAGVMESRISFIQSTLE